MIKLILQVSEDFFDGLALLQLMHSAQQLANITGKNVHIQELDGYELACVSPEIQ